LARMSQDDQEGDLIYRSPWLTLIFSNKYKAR